MMVVVVLNCSLGALPVEQQTVFSGHFPWPASPSVMVERERGRPFEAM